VLTLLLLGLVVVVAAAFIRGRSGRSTAHAALEQDDHATRVLEAARLRAEDQEAGGRPESAIMVSSPAVVEPNAQARRCLRCGALQRVQEHRAETITGMRLRLVDVQCRGCGHLRTLHYRLPRALVN
jgi:hypothetical protein